MLLGLSCAYDSPGDSVKIQILIQRPWGWSGGGAEILHFSQPPPHSSAGKECTRDAGDPSSIPGLGRSPGEGIGYPRQYSWASLVAQLVKHQSAMWGDLGFDPWVGKILWRRPGEFHGLYSPWGHKELDMTERLKKKNLPSDAAAAGLWTSLD